MKTVKWYDENTNKSAVLSSRVRLARNFADYPFPLCAANEIRTAIINKSGQILSKSPKVPEPLFMYKTETLDEATKRSMVDKHLISSQMAGNVRYGCVFVSDTEKVSVMVCEEDHLRIQSVETGDGIENAFERANAIETILEEGGYAFDKNMGYLTSCPTNIGTGMRASCMIHIPYLERSGQVGDVAAAIGKFGFTIRGTFGEGSKAHGSVYQVSNQITAGVTEESLVAGLKSLIQQITEKEISVMNANLSSDRVGAEDQVYRAYGLLTNARRITEPEAISNLSMLKIGAISGLLTLELPNIYGLTINIRNAALAKNFNVAGERDIAVKRAEYLRKALRV